MRIKPKIYLFFIILLIVILVLPQVRVIIKSTALLKHVFSNGEINVFEIYNIEEFTLNEKTKFYVLRPDEGRHPALIFSLGFGELGAKDPRLQKPIEGFIKSGFAVLLVDSQDMKRGLIKESEIENLVLAFTYLKEKSYVDKNKIGFVGISVGSSLALIASSQEEIRNDVLFVLWTGGYYNLEELVIDVLSKSYVHEGKTVDWQVDPWVREIIIKNIIAFVENETDTNVIKLENREELENLIANASPVFVSKMKVFSPKSYIHDVNAKVYILHDRRDKLIPFTHSLELKKDLGDSLGGTVITEAFVHVTPEINFTAIKPWKEYLEILLFTREIFMLVE